MPETLLTPDERIFAETKENAYLHYSAEIAGRYEMALDKAYVIGPAIRYIDEHDSSGDPAEQGRVWAYEDFLKSIGGLQ